MVRALERLKDKGREEKKEKRKDENISGINSECEELYYELVLISLYFLLP